MKRSNRPHYPLTEAQRWAIWRRAIDFALTLPVTRGAASTDDDLAEDAPSAGDGGEEEMAASQQAGEAQNARSITSS